LHTEGRPLGKLPPWPDRRGVGGGFAPGPVRFAPNSLRMLTGEAAWERRRKAPMTKGIGIPQTRKANKQ